MHGKTSLKPEPGLVDFERRPDPGDQHVVIRAIAEGVVPRRQVVQVRIPFNLVKSKTLVRAMEGADDLEPSYPESGEEVPMVSASGRCRGVYYRPGTFRSSAVE